MKRLQSFFSQWKHGIGLLLLVWGAWFFTRLFADLSQINAQVNLALAQVASLFALAVGYLFKDK
jgi:hypothetical protein